VAIGTGMGVLANRRQLLCESAHTQYSVLSNKSCGKSIVVTRARAL
jgi:hypothetical protein